MRSRAQTIRLGVFVAVAGGLFFGLLVVLAGTRLLRKQDHYTIYFSETVSGLEVGAAVKSLGVRIGQIDSFRVKPHRGQDRVEVSIGVEAGTPIRSNARARLSGSGITGLMFVEITGGTADAPLIEPGGEIPADPSLLGVLTGKAEQIALKLEEVLTRALALVSETNVANVGHVLANLEAASSSARDITADLRGSVEPIVSASNQLGPTLQEFRTAAAAVTEAAKALRADGALRSTVLEAGRTLRTAQDLLGGDRAAELSRDLGGAVNSFTDTMNQLGIVLGSSSRDFREISASLRDAAENLEEFARSIREDPSLLIRSTQGRD